MVSGVPSLFQIAQNVCIKQAAHILDVGDTPYHLVQPILKRLNAKQLAQLEENSPIVVPHSDELWGLLVERDFPDRPCNPAKTKISGTSENAKMPLRSLYQKYAVERDHFRATSADRLRKMTAKLRREKSKNAITTVHEVLADPTIRRRNTQYSGLKTTFHKPKPTSILGKARRDVSQRSLMFGGPSKPYDPYKAFQGVSKPPEERPFSPPNRACSRSPARANAQSSSNIHKIAELPVSPSPKSPSTVPNNNADSSDIQQPAVESQASPVRDPMALRKRKPAPSIFLNTRKRPRPVPVPTKPPAGSGNARQSAPESRPESKPIKAIKSSIFH